ncbi:hypothetical protein [Thalassococcus sp. S3]|uniref:hypothetical protein n=1 Tax=Thalassococcus sp. S3 TaxID=2017482 RepID=UPI0010248ADF|nr:hypothetical protein [Thalassococcus sp. S3]QBF32142.1 hypothetical protein CFI11_13065 [Thalassococcus sp. S3]
MANAIIGALRAVLGLDTAAFEQGVGVAEKRLAGFRKSMERASRKLSKAGSTLSTRVTAPLAGIATVAVRSSLKTVDAQAKMGESFDTSVGSLQVLSRAADIAGISQGDLEGSMRRLTRRISLAEQGTGAGAKAFERLGLTAADFADLDMDERIKLIQERLAEYVPEAERAGVASQMFGDLTGLAMLRLNADVIETAREEVERFGIVISEVDADQIEQTNDAISAMALAVRGLGNQVTVALAPTIQRLAEALADAVAWFNNLTPETQRFVAVSATLAAALGPVLMGLGFLVSGLAALASPIGIAIFGFGVVAGAVGYLVTQWDELTARLPALEGLVDVASDLAKYWADLPPIKWALLIPALKWGLFIKAIPWLSLAKKLAWTVLIKPLVWSARFIPVIGWAVLAGQLAWEFLIKPLNWGRFIPRIDWSKFSFNFSWERIFDGVAGVSRGRNAGRRTGKAMTDGLAEGINAGVPEVEAAGASAGDAAINAAEQAAGIQSPSREFMRIGRQMMEGLKLGIDQEAPTAVAKIGSVADDMIQAAETGFSGLGNAMAPLQNNGAFRSVTSGIRSISDALADVAVDGRDAGETLGQVFKRMSRDLISSGLQNLLSSVFSPLSGIGGGGGGGFLSGLFGNVFGGFFDEGGRLGSNQWGIVGEYGPEIVEGPANIISRRDTARMFDNDPTPWFAELLVSITTSEDLHQTAATAGANAANVHIQERQRAQDRGLNQGLGA